MQTKRAIKCPVGSKRFIVVKVAGDTYAGRSFEDAMDAAQPDRGNRVSVFATCADEVGSARMLFPGAPKQLIRSFVYRGGGRRSPPGQGRRKRRKG